MPQKADAALLALLIVACLCCLYFAVGLWKAALVAGFVLATVAMLYWIVGVAFYACVRGEVVRRQSP